MLLISEKDFFSNFLFNDLLKLSNDLKKLQKYDKSEFVKDMSLACDKVICKILELPYAEENIYSAKNLDSIVIEKNSINMLPYNSLKFFNYMYYILYVKENSNIDLYEYKISKKLIDEKEFIIKSGLYALEDMDMEQFQILFEFLSSSAKDWYAIDCDVEPEELTPEVMYNKYHKEENILKRC